MTNEIPTNTKNTNKPYKRDIFEAYVIWKSIPAFFRNSTPQKVAIKLGVTETEIFELIGIRNQTEFAKKYSIENSTLTNWNKLIEKNNTILDMRKWAKKLTKNVLFALYKNTTEHGDAMGTRLWMEIVENWDLKNKENIGYHGVTEFTIVRK